MTTITRGSYKRKVVCSKREICHSWATVWYSYSNKDRKRAYCAKHSSEFESELIKEGHIILRGV